MLAKGSLESGKDWERTDEKDRSPQKAGCVHRVVERGENY